MVVQTAQPLPDIGYAFTAYPPGDSERVTRIIIGTSVGGVAFLLMVILVLISVLLRRSARFHRADCKESTPAVLEASHESDLIPSPSYHSHSSRASTWSTYPRRPLSSLSLSHISSPSPTIPTARPGHRSKGPPPSYVSSPRYYGNQGRRTMSIGRIPSPEASIANLVDAHSMCGGHPADPRSLPRPETSVLFLPEYTDSGHHEVIHIDDPHSWPASVLNRDFEMASETMSREPDMPASLKSIAHGVLG